VAPDGRTQRGFAVYVGGGLGAVPHQAKLLGEFVPEEDLLPLARAVGRVFGRLGEKKNRNKARVKFLVQKLGIEEFKRIVFEEFRTMPEDPSWREHFDQIPRYEETATWQGVQLNGVSRPPGFDDWAATNVYPQRQNGYVVATVTCPLGDLTSDQMRAVAEISRRYAGGNCRTTVEQNLVLRWVSHGKVVDLYKDLAAIGLAEPGAGSIVDVVACPGTDTCKLGIASSRGLAGELRHRLIAQQAQKNASTGHLRIKVSGCFNSCGQHHVADLGFYGNSRNIGGYTVPHFQVMLGGQWSENAGSYALAMGSVPSKRIPDLVAAFTDRYTKEKQGDESFQKWCQRIGKKELKAIVDKFTPVPSHAEDASFYTDWGDPREFTIGDMGVGECAGEIVTMVQFGFTQAESEAFEAQLLLDDGHFAEADAKAYSAMLTAARTLVQMQLPDVPSEAEVVVREFRTRFVEPKLFWDTYHHDQFSRYLFQRFEGSDQRFTRDTAHKLIEEANLFIDAAYKCHAKVQSEKK
jgi:sulfite reductase (ferredoxin)